MNKFFKRGIAAGLGLGMLAWGVAAKAEVFTVDETRKTTGWTVDRNLAATGTLSITDGPSQEQPAIRMKYDLSGGNWVVMQKDLPEGLPKVKTITFDCRGEGKYSFEFKVIDNTGANFGIKFAGGANLPQWKKIVIPIDQIKYMWAGTNQVLYASNIRKIAFSVYTNEEGGTGSLWVSNVQASTEEQSPVFPEGVRPETAKGELAAGFASKRRVELMPADSWEKYIDRGAAFSVNEAPGLTEAQRAVQAVFTWGTREIPGVQEQKGNWASMVKTIQTDLSEMRNLVFIYKGTGAISNLEVKIKDKAGAVYGKAFPSSSAPASWMTLVIPRSDLKYYYGGDGSGKMDWIHVQTIEFTLSRAGDSRDSGTFTVGEIHFESAVSAAAPLKSGKKGEAVPEGQQIKVDIDAFSDLNPANLYYVVAGDDSTLSLESSRITFSADFSMKMRYNLESTRPTGSWVEAERRFNLPLDWGGVDAVKIWVKGDGSHNVFRFTITDGENKRWVFENQEVLASTDWFLVDMPLSAFVLYENLYQKEKMAGGLEKQRHSIKAYAIGIVSQPARSSLTEGEIYVERLYAVGMGINESRAVPIADKPPVGIAVPLKNWNLGGMSATQLENNKVAGSGITQEVKFKITGNFEKASVFGEMQMFSTYGNETDAIKTKSASVNGTNMGVTLLNPLNGVNTIQLGYLWFNSSPDIFANDNLYGGWGFAGVQVEGWVDQIHHRTYFLKHAPDSSTLAGHYSATMNGLNLNLIGSYYSKQPFNTTATLLQQDDQAFLADASQHFSVPGLFEVNLRASGGYDSYREYYDPNQRIPLSLRQTGALGEGEINFTELGNIFWNGLNFSGKYRYVEPYYKPTFRQHPGYWDVEFGDQDGYSVRAYQALGSAYISAEYKKFDRVSSRDQGTEKTLLSIGYNDWSSMDITLTQEFQTIEYIWTDDRYLVNDEPVEMQHNRRERNSTAYVAYHLSGTVVLSEWFQFKDVRQVANEDHYFEMASVTKFSYYPAPNLSLSLESKFTRYQLELENPVIDPKDPYSLTDYTRVRVEMTF